MEESIQNAALMFGLTFDLKEQQRLASNRVSPLIALIKDQVSQLGVFTIIYAYYCRFFHVRTAEWLLVTFVGRVMIMSKILLSN